MRTSEGSPRVIRFGTFEANLVTGELRRQGVRVRLQEQSFQVLRALLERPGELVSRKELRERIWPSAVFVDFDHGLNKAVNKLRAALNDSADSPRFVETLARRGYRFIAITKSDSKTGARAPSRPAQVSGCRVVWNGRVIPLREGVNTIGRADDSTVCVDSSKVSRRHARILVTGNRAVLEDLGSKNGTYVGSRRIEAPTSLQDGDEIRVGSAGIVFHMFSGLTSTRSDTRSDTR